MIDSILIVEDDDMDGELIERTLRPNCRSIRRVRSVSEGMAEMERYQPDVVLLDVCGVGASSPEHAIQQIKSVRTSAAIVVLSGVNDPIEIERGILSTASGWVVKGSWRNLLHEVRCALAYHRNSMTVLALKSEVCPCI